MPRGYVVVNRRAGKLRADSSPLLAQCRARATLKVFETETLADLDAAARGIAAAPAPVVLAGGDGSHGAGVTALVNAFEGSPIPAVALLKGGTVNTVARGFGVASARRLLDAVESGAAASTRRPTLRVRSRLFDVTPNGRAAFIVGAGLVTRFFELYDGSGLANAAAICARVFAGSFVGGRTARRVLEPQACTIHIDGTPAPFAEVSLVCASVVANVGLGLRLTYRAGESLERFHVVATPLPPRALGPQMLRVLAAKPLRGARVDALATEVTLAFSAGSGAYVVDGELVRDDALVVTAGPSIDVIGAQP